MTDAANNGLIQVPLTDFVKQIAIESGKAGAMVVIQEHSMLCDAKRLIDGSDGVPPLEERIRKLERCNDDVAGIAGWVLRNWKIAVVAVAILVGWMRGGRIDAKALQDAIANLPQTTGQVGK